MRFFRIKHLYTLTLTAFLSVSAPAFGQTEEIADILASSLSKIPAHLRANFIQAVSASATQAGIERYPEAFFTDAKENKIRQVYFSPSFFISDAYAAETPVGDTCLFAGHRSSLVKVEGKNYRLCTHPKNLANGHEYRVAYEESYQLLEEIEQQSPVDCKSQGKVEILCHPVLYGGKKICVGSDRQSSTNSSLRCMSKAFYQDHAQESVDSIVEMVNSSEDSREIFAQTLADVMDLCLCGSGKRISKSYYEHIHAHRTCAGLLDAVEKALSALGGNEPVQNSCLSPTAELLGLPGEAAFKSDASELVSWIRYDLERRRGYHGQGPYFEKEDMQGQTLERPYLDYIQALTDEKRKVVETLEASYASVTGEVRAICENPSERLRSLTESKDNGEEAEGGPTEEDSPNEQGNTEDPDADENPGEEAPVSPEEDLEENTDETPEEESNNSDEDDYTLQIERKSLTAGVDPANQVGLTAVLKDENGNAVDLESLVKKGKATITWIKGKFKGKKFEQSQAVENKITVIVPNYIVSAATPMDNLVKNMETDQFEAIYSAKVSMTKEDGEKITLSAYADVPVEVVYPLQTGTTFGLF